MSSIIQHRDTGHYIVLKMIRSDIPTQRNHTSPSPQLPIRSPDRREFLDSLPQRCKLAYRSIFKGNTNILPGISTLLPHTQWFAAQTKPTFSHTQHFWTIWLIQPSHIKSAFPVFVASKVKPKWIWKGYEKKLSERNQEITASPEDHKKHVLEQQAQVRPVLLNNWLNYAPVQRTRRTDPLASLAFMLP